ncbi:MAG: hypothetical protein ACI9S8_000310, partial [Chlamydiales bacterium]
EEERKRRGTRRYLRGGKVNIFKRNASQESNERHYSGKLG